MFKVDNTGFKIAMSFFGLDDTLQATFQNPQLNPNADLKNCLIRPFGPPPTAELEKDCSGDPKGPYCANLGHVQDDESGLIYMRARYYEPTSGRFISEDPDKQGSNWFEYAIDQPTWFADSSGKDPTPAQLFWAILGGTCAVVATGLGLCGPIETGAVLLVLGIQVLNQMGSVGRNIAVALDSDITESMFAGIGAVAVLAMAAEAAVCGVLCLWDDAGGINDLF